MDVGEGVDGGADAAHLAPGGGADVGLAGAVDRAGRWSGGGRTTDRQLPDVKRMTRSGACWS